MSQTLRINFGLNLTTGNQQVESFASSLSSTVGNVVQKHQFKLEDTESKAFVVVEGQTFVVIPVGTITNVRVRDDSSPTPVTIGSIITGMPFIISSLADLENFSIVALDTEGDGGEFIVYILSPA